jgi:hypothetical protein
VEGAIERVVADTPYASIVPVNDLAFVVTSLFMGIELTMILEEDQQKAESLFRAVGLMATLLEGLLGATSGAAAQDAPGDRGRKRTKRR